MAGRHSSNERAREQTTGVVERTYADIVLDQFRKNRLAVFGLRVIAFLILVAIFAPFLANSRPILFYGYRYRSYIQAYDQLVYAHADLFGVGRAAAKAGDAPETLKIPGLYAEGVQLPGLADAYRREVSAWDAGTQTWKQVRDVSYDDSWKAYFLGDETNALMNALRLRLEEEIPNLDKDNRWARGGRSIAWLKEKKLPADIVKDLDRLVELGRSNLDRNYRAKAQMRVKALIQQLDTLRQEVSSADGKQIDAFAARYTKAVGADFHKRDAAELAKYGELLLEIRKRLAPVKSDEEEIEAARREGRALEGIAFQPHADFPAIRQLDGLEVFFILAVFLFVSRGLWGRVFAHKRPQDAMTAKGLTIVLVPAACALVWTLAVPSFKDTTDYRAGMLNGDLACNFRLMAPIRYDVNDNDPNNKWSPPWWLPYKPGQGDDAANPVAVVAPAKTPLERNLRELRERVDRLKNTPYEGGGGWSGFLDFLNRHHMGTDGTGRDLLTRMIWGSRISLSIGFVSVGIYVFIGIIIGALAGYFGGWVDIVTSRIIEIVICFPTFFLILTVIAFLGPSIWNIMFVIGITGWPGVARLVRGEFLRLRNRDFVTAGKALGYGDARVIFRHILPNALAPVLVAATFGVASAILVESSLSFLGFGVKVPTPTWGSVLSSARESWIYWWITLFPGFAIFLTVTMYNLVGEGIRDAVDPKLRQ